MDREIEMDYIRDLLRGAEKIVNILIENDIPEKYAIAFISLVLAHGIVKDMKTYDEITDLTAIFVELYRAREEEE